MERDEFRVVLAGGRSRERSKESGERSGYSLGDGRYDASTVALDCEESWVSDGDRLRDNRHLDL